MDIFRYDFGYAWPWTYGHLIASVVFCLLAWLAQGRKWPRSVISILILSACWGVVGFGVVQFALHANLPLHLPTERFFTQGRGRILDAGAGSGRSTLMVLLARPESSVVALDLYNGCCGIPDNTPARLTANAQLAGVGGRLEVKVGDMRLMPFVSGSMDAAVSAFAIDHLDRKGIEMSLFEVARVLRPGGEFLLMVINNDAWIRTAYPFLIHHGYFGPKTNPERWENLLRNAGFEITESGTRPATLYLLASKRR